MCARSSRSSCRPSGLPGAGSSQRFTMRTLLILCLAVSAGSSALAQETWKVDPAKQLQLDAARRSILEDELAAEAKLFVEAHAELREARGRNAADSAESMDRHRRNLAALTREMARGESEPAKALLKRPEGGRPDWVISP